MMYACMHVYLYAFPVLTVCLYKNFSNRIVQLSFSFLFFTLFLAFTFVYCFVCAVLVGCFALWACVICPWLTKTLKCRSVQRVICQVLCSFIYLCLLYLFLKVYPSVPSSPTLLSVPSSLTLLSVPSSLTLPCTHSLHHIRALSHDATFWSRTTSPT